MFGHPVSRSDCLTPGRPMLLRRWLAVTLAAAVAPVTFFAPSTFLATGLAHAQATDPNQPPPRKGAPRPTSPAPATPTPATPTPTSPGSTPSKPSTPAAPGSTPSNPAPSKPSTPSSPPAKPAPAPKPLAMVEKRLLNPGPLVKRVKPKDWTFSVRLEVQGREFDQVIQDSRGRTTRMPRQVPFTFERLALVFPVTTQTASSVTKQDSWKGRLRIADKAVAAEPKQMIDNLPSGARYARWEVSEGGGDELDLEFEYQMTTYNVEVDEAAALKVAWPKGAYPPEAQSTFDQQIFINFGPDPDQGGQSLAYDAGAINAVVESWLNENKLRDPKGVPPYALAKMFAASFIRAFQPTGEGLSYNKRGSLEGVRIEPLHFIIQQGRGSPFELNCLLVAIYRAVGLPARLVIGYQGESDDSRFLSNSSSGKGLRSWVEFCIFDENFEPDRASVNWIPVDVISQRKSSSRPPPLEKTWKYFGNHPELENTLPLAFQLHPPMPMRAYSSPGLWGWAMTPTTPAGSSQSLLFRAVKTAKRGGEKDEGDKPSTPRRGGQRP
ncbi:MAG: transglutaminase-like domain-containing protein [Planctomycetota bacterium]|nr:transglutaminase-like domain-containing protein [Planctomycetota bacterium]